MKLTQAISASLAGALSVSEATSSYSPRGSSVASGRTWRVVASSPETPRTSRSISVPSGAITLWQTSSVTRSPGRPTSLPSATSCPSGPSQIARAAGRASRCSR